MALYPVTKKGRIAEPHRLEDILVGITSGDFWLYDYIYNPEKGQWELMLESSLIPDSYKKIPSQGVSELSHERPWYVFRQGRQFGPYSYLEMVKMLQTKNLGEFDFVWSTGFNTWIRLGQVPEFSPEAIEKLRQMADPKIEQVFFRRRFPRIPISAKVWVHDQKRIWQGQAQEMSAGGLGVLLRLIEDIDIKDVLVVHFPRDVLPGLPTFNAIAEVVSVRQVSDLDKKIGLSFLKINQDVQLHLHLVTQKAA